MKQKFNYHNSELIKGFSKPISDKNFQNLENSKIKKQYAETA